MTVSGSLRRLAGNRWVPLVDLILVVVSGLAWILIPRFAIWFTLLAFLSWGVKIFAGRLAFHRTPFDWFIAIFLITAWIGYWAAYDKTAAWTKVWLIVTAVLLYYTLGEQPTQNLEILSILSFGFALGLSIYFFLTDDFTGSRGGISTWWMSHRPQVHWPAIHPGYTAGLLILTSVFAFYWLWNIRKKAVRGFNLLTNLFLSLGIGTIIWAFLLSMSHEVWAIAIGVLAISIAQKVPTLAEHIAKPRMRSAFPILVLVGLAALIFLFYLGPARASADTSLRDYGDNSRAELFARSAYFLADYPILGGGLASFPGLYSKYILAIPNYYFVDSYNIFLDVAIEQGLIGGLAFALIYLGSIWLVSRTIVSAPLPQIRLLSWLALFALVVTVIHGLFYDYLYNGDGTLLLLFPVGISMISVKNLDNPVDSTTQLDKTSFLWNEANSRRMFAVFLLGIVTILTLNINKMASIWYANLGAVQMSQVELQKFPTNGWAGFEIVPALEGAQDSLRSAVEYDPSNETANYRLGIIFMLRQNFEVASQYLEAAQAKAPNHRGIIKSLGYCYVWLGNLDAAQLLLAKIPEAQTELDAYVGWWATHGRPDLSEKASMMAARLESSR